MFTQNFPINYPNDNTNDKMGTSSMNWNHQPPESVPWSVFSQPGVTRFSGNQELGCNKQGELHNFQLSLWNPPDNSWSGQNDFPFAKPTKRKGEELLDRKQFITEEKIAAHMSQLNISSAAEAVPVTKPKVKRDTSLTEGLRVGPDAKLVLSKELKRFQQESSLPASLLESLAKPTMAVVLWQPRNQVHLLASTDRQEERTAQPVIEREEPQNVNADIEILEDDSNNNEPISNFNIDEGIQQNPLEPVDLDMDEDL